MGDASEPIQAELPWLYELSLALGRSLDLGATCRGFLRALVTRPGLTGAAIWWRTAEGETAAGLALLDAWPRCAAPVAVLPLTHPVWHLSRGGEPLVLSPGEVEPGALGWDADGETAAMALYPLGADGVLLLRSSELDLLTPPMLARLGVVVGNLALAIQHGLEQVRLTSSEAALRQSESQFRALGDAGTVPIGNSGTERWCNYVSPRKEAELAPAESEIRLRHTLENTPNVAVQWYDLGGRVVYWNPASERLYGWSSAEALGKTLDQLFFSAEEAAAFGVLLHRLAQSGEVSGPAEYRTRDRQGHPRIVMGTTFPIPSDNQKDQILVCMDVDITDRKAAEDSLRLAASVFSHAREGIMITAPNGDILDVNDAFTRIAGYLREEVLGRNPRILSSGRQDRAFYAAMWGDLIDKGHWYGEIWNRRKTGDEYVALLTVSAVHDAQGEILRYVALFSDITQSKEHERQLLHIAH